MRFPVEGLTVASSLELFVFSFVVWVKAARSVGALACLEGGGVGGGVE